jgi:hypothetical protein
MAGCRVTAAQRWFAAQTEGAPGPLRERAAAYLELTARGGNVAGRLGSAAAAALATVLAHPGDRSVALDLLAADALLTLSLKAQAVHDPGSLAEFAAALRAPGGALR